jgi:acetyl-CoA carboxylase carboxyl transferase subunit beta
MAWFTRKDPGLAEQAPATSEERRVKTEGLWIKCDRCRQVIWRKALEENFQVCPKCDFHFRLDAWARIRLLLDEEPAFTEYDAGLQSTDPLDFVDSKPYRDRLGSMRKSTGLNDAVIAVSGFLTGIPIELAVFDLRFTGGSMGSVVGEKLARAAVRSLEQRHPLLIASASGGARMQEGAISLMQMAKVAAVLMKLDKERIPFISLLTDPTTGGVTASFAMLGDLNIAEPGALIAFAGPRVIEQTIRQKLPEGFQRSEFLLQHGFLDAVVSRHELKPYLARALRFMTAR